MRLIKEYCCCAIPILNAGIYITLTEQFVVAATAGILTLVTPPIVGMSVPSFGPPVFAVLCFLTAGVQLFGFLGVFRESTIVFRRYTTLHLLTATAVFSFAAVFIAISATKHSTTSANCVTSFFPADPTATATALTGSDSEGRLLCNVFTWIGVGTVAGLWLVLAIFHAYLFFVVSGYGSSQRADHSKYYSLYSLNSYPDPTLGAHPSFYPADNIGMQNMATGHDAWDARQSMETVGFEKPQPYPQQAYPTGPATYPPPPRRHGSDATLYSVEQAMARGPTPKYQDGYTDPYYGNAALVGTGKPQPGMTYPS